MGKNHFIRKIISFIVFAFVLTLSSAFCFADQGDDYIMGEGFPDSYLEKLRKLHKEHPNWKFKPASTGLSFGKSVKGMMKVPGVNTIWRSSAPSYKSAEQGAFNYLTNTYFGGSFVRASKLAVKYYMDPRNFLDEEGIFIFEDKRYASYQTKGLVKKIVKSNKVLYKNAQAFVDAGKKYDISPIYLSAKAISEIGSSTYMVNGHSFSYGGRRYSKCYNPYNIGSSDSKGKNGGLVYAAKKKWNTPAKAISGGAKFLRSSFIDVGQPTAYTEHFNVMNGEKAVGTHIYMSLVAGPCTIGASVSNRYRESGIYDKAIEFTIPVFDDMPEKVCKKPSGSSKKDNNNHLKSLSVKGENKKVLIRSGKQNYKRSFTVTVPSEVEEVTIKAGSASRTKGKVRGTGTFNVDDGTNVFYLKSVASSGDVRKYKVKVKK